MELLQSQSGGYNAVNHIMIISEADSKGISTPLNSSKCIVYLQ